jgi:hypothetical protein
VADPLVFGPDEREAPPGPCRVEIKGDGYSATVRVDGHQVAAVGLTLTMRAERLPQLLLDLPVTGGQVVTLTQAVVIAGDETREALIAMGWTPPSG